MSSSDNYPDWSVFTEREVPAIVEVISPASEVISLLQLHQRAIDTEKRTTAQVKEEGQEALAQQAVYVAELAAALERYKPEFEEVRLRKVYRILRLIKDQMLTALQNAGLKIVNPLGKPFDEVAEDVNVIGWRHHTDFVAEVVAEVLEPIVSSNGRLIRPGCVIIGAPLEQKPVNMEVTESEIE